MQASGAPSLYDRLGGVYDIATVIDDFIDRIMVHPRLNANPRVDEARISSRVQVSRDRDGLLGVRRSAAVLGPLHGGLPSHLMITEAEWQAFMDDLQQSFNKFEVPHREQAELNAIVESTKEAIVVAPPFQEGPTDTASGTAQP